MSEILIQVTQLYRYYGDTCAVHDVTFSLHKGQVLGFLGLNGAGKSSTMAMLAGSLAPHSGRILINGIDLLEEPRRAKATVGYLPERPPLYRDCTVDEYLRYCARLHRLPSTAIPAALARAKARCGLAEVGRRLIGNLSKGFQQRVGIAQAIIHDPAVVILDEPTVGLDPLQIREIRSLIQELGQQQGVILSTHILSEVQAVCSDVQIIHRGRLVFAGALADLAPSPRNTSLVVAFRTPPIAAVLHGLPTVTGVEDLGNGRFRLQGGAEFTTELVKQACAQDWGLQELTPERTNLEQVFIDLTLDGEAA